MKTQEEIKQLAKEKCTTLYNGFFGYIQGYTSKDVKALNDGYEMGYTKCQEDMADKKYTEEDIRKVIDETIKACNISQKESYGDLEIDTDKIINSLNKQG